jgi:hypothetical protein
MDTTLVDAATVAAKLGQAKTSIYRLAQSGLIPHTQQVSILMK